VPDFGVGWILFEARVVPLHRKKTMDDLLAARTYSTELASAPRRLSLLKLVTRSEAPRSIAPQTPYGISPPRWQHGMENSENRHGGIWAQAYRVISKSPHRWKKGRGSLGPPHVGHA